jgi:hypothetical protein
MIMELFAGTHAPSGFCDEQLHDRERAGWVIASVPAGIVTVQGPRVARRWG